MSTCEWNNSILIFNDKLIFISKFWCELSDTKDLQIGRVQVDIKKKLIVKNERQQLRYSQKSHNLLRIMKITVISAGVRK